MIRKIKSLLGVVVVCCIFLHGCGREETPEKILSEPMKTEVESITEREPAGTAEAVSEDMKETESAGMKETESEEAKETETVSESWETAYLEYLDEYEREYEEINGCTYSLIYVNEDEIPELVIDTGYEAGGCEILTYYEGNVDVMQTARLHFDYIEKGNLLCNSDGHMGYYYDYVFAIENGKWAYIGGGEYGDGEDGVQFDENGDYIFVYSWEGENIEEQEYEQRLSEIYDNSKTVEPQKYYVLKEIRSILKTGEVSSAKHRYELITEDLTWEEAQKACKEKGGYLATISSVDEFQRIEEQIVKEEKTNITFWVGGKHLEEEGLWGYYWLEQGESHDAYSMLDLFNAYWGFWLDGEPSYSGLTESGEEVDERYVVLFYRTADKRAYLNDVPNDILAAAPSYTGKVGYICEYDEK